MSEASLAPREELKALRHLCDQLEDDNARLLASNGRLVDAIAAAIGCEDTCLRDGTQATLRRVLELLQAALCDDVMADALWEKDELDENAIECTECGRTLSPASEAAGCCLKCVAR